MGAVIIDFLTAKAYYSAAEADEDYGPLLRRLGLHFSVQRVNAEPTARSDAGTLGGEIPAPNATPELDVLLA